METFHDANLVLVAEGNDVADDSASAAAARRAVDLHQRLDPFPVAGDARDGHVGLRGDAVEAERTGDDEGGDEGRMLGHGGAGGETLRAEGGLPRATGTNDCRLDLG